MESREAKLAQNLLESIRELGLDTSKMTLSEIAEATGFSTGHVSRTLRINAMPYISRRFGGRSSKGQARLGGLTAVTIDERKYSPNYTVPTNSRHIVGSVLALGDKTASMTVSEIATEAGLSYLTAQRIVKKHNIRHI